MGTDPDTCSSACGGTEQSLCNRTTAVVLPFPGGLGWAHVTLWSGCETVWNSAGLLRVLQVWSALKNWSVDGARVAAIAGAGDAVEGCVPGGPSTHTRIRPRAARWPPCRGVRRNSTGGRLRIWRCPMRPARRISGGEL